MFSEESMISMGDGSFKNISKLREFDFIYNKLKNPVKINTIIKVLQQQVLKVILSDSTFFYTTYNTLFLCVYQKENGFVSKYLDIISIKNLDAKLKKSLKIFNNETNIGIINVNIGFVKDVYKLTTLDEETSYFINGVITKC